MTETPKLVAASSRETAPDKKPQGGRREKPVSAQYSYGSAEHTFFSGYGRRSRPDFPIDPDSRPTSISPARIYACSFGYQSECGDHSPHRGQQVSVHCFMQLGQIPPVSN